MELKEEVFNCFNSSFTTSIQEAMVKCLFQSYTNAYEYCKKYNREEAHDLLGFLRWIELRDQLRGLGGRFNEIQTFEKPNGSASSYHIVIEGDKIILTVSSVPFPSILPRPASYRLEYSVQSQLYLFEKEKKKLEKIYGILIHGANPKDRTKPAFLQVRFPERDYGAYIPHRIDLFSKYSTLVKSLLGKSSEEEKSPKPKIAIKVKNEA